MITIKIPNNNLKEREYIIDVIFKEFLDLNYEVVIVDGDSDSWDIELENGNKLIIKDAFFNKYPKDLEYLKEENIPKKVEFIKNEFAPKNNIVVIYGGEGEGRREKEEGGVQASNPSTLTTNIDIFASAFFMLTRWEEFVIKSRDEHNRFDAKDSLAYKNNFLHRAVVNEYVEMLKNMLSHLGYNGKFKEREFNYLLTHDVDWIAKWDTPKKFFRHLGGDLILRKSIKQFFQSLYGYILMLQKRQNDPYDSFDFLIDVSEKLNTKSYFFFMAEGETKFDNNYSPMSKRAIEIANKIKSRGHYIGIHPTYNAYNNSDRLKKEKEQLEKIYNTKITFGREHYLRFELPTTWQIWEDNSMAWDSTMGYATKEGFRCGVCYEFSTFNILTREKLKLKERPLIAMEATFLDVQSINEESIYGRVDTLIKEVKRYNGEFVFLWHNSNFNKRYKALYKKVLFENQEDK